MNNVKEFDEFDKELFDKIVKHVNDDNSPFDDSKLYSVAEEQLKVDKSYRSSKFKLIKDSNLFDLIDQYVDKINNVDKDFEYKLVRNDVTIIRYEQDDFFSEHADYLSFTSNEVQEFTLILCLDADCDGGETKLKINDFFTHYSKNTKTTGQSLLFRKDFVHEGTKLSRGHKLILTVNLLGFPNIGDSIAVITVSDKKWSIPYKNIEKHSVILTKMLEDDNKKIKLLEIDDCTPDEFELIYGILMDSYINLKDWEKHSDVIDKFGVDISKVLFSTTSKKSNVKEISFNKQLLLFNNESDMKYANQLIKVNELPYITFKILFCEGSTTYGGEMTGTPAIKYKMLPFWVSFTDYNHILHVCKLMTTGNFSKELNAVVDTFVENSDYTQEHRCHIGNFFDKPIEEYFYFKNEYDEEDEEDGVKEDGVCNLLMSSDIDYNPITYFDLEYAVPNITNKDIFKQILENYWQLYNYKFYSTQNEQNDDGEHYLLDADGNSYLNKTQTELLKSKLRDINFFETIKEQLNSLSLNLPQVKESREHFFCNENVYVNTTMIVVTGAIRME